MKIPIILEDYLDYMETIKGTSSNTVKEYYFDLRTFLRFLKIRYKLVESTLPFDEIEIDDIKIDLIRQVDIQDLFAYISYADKKDQTEILLEPVKLHLLDHFLNTFIQKLI